MKESSFRLKVSISRRIQVGKKGLEREEFFDWLWRNFLKAGMLGIHEGTLLTEEASKQGLETESWTVDAGEAPRERDWIQSQRETHAELYFASQEQAEKAAAKLSKLEGLQVGAVEEQKAEDWDAQWKASFMNAGDGVRIPPYWRVLPPWSSAKVSPDERILRVNPGAGFGTGTHETTQLCLQALADCWPRDRKPKVLDFGSGSGILTIAAGLLGAEEALGVEIDPLAIENAQDNARLNEIGERVRFQRQLTGVTGPFDIVLANILKPVLLEYCAELCDRMERQRGVLILSGLIEQDVKEVAADFSSILKAEPEVRALNEWRCLVWRYQKFVSRS